MRQILLAGVMLSIVGCGGMAITPTAPSDGAPQDGELAFPFDYKSFPTFLHGIQKPNAVRDLYINQRGAETQKGAAFANGSILVMEIHNAKKNTDDTYVKGHDGNLVKDGLAKIFVMQKGERWGNNAPEGLKNGDWMYSAFKPNGDRLDIGYEKCRSCHIPLGESKDYVHRYDEYFMKRVHSY